MSVPCDQFLAEMRKGSPNWTVAIDALSSLAMFEMLPALAQVGRLSQVADQAVQILAKQRGWGAPAQRIKWATEVVRDQRIPPPPSGLPPEQVGDAKTYLYRRTEEKRGPRPLVQGEPRFTNAGLIRSLYQQGKYKFGSKGAERLFKQAVFEEKVTGKTAKHASELQAVLAALGPRGLKIMRTFAPGQGPHGSVEGSSIVCRAIDIIEYDGRRFHYQIPRETLIQNVEALFRALPSGPSYDIGFVRPVGGKTGSDTKLDVFFSVPPARAAAAFEPDGSWGIGQMLEPPKNRVLAALRGKSVGNVFPDGADHMHIKAY